MPQNSARFMQLDGRIVVVSGTAGDGLGTAVARRRQVPGRRSSIRVNAIAPEAMVSPASLSLADPALGRQTIPMGRQGELEKYVGTILFLLSNLSTIVVVRLSVYFMKIQPGR